jgi:hypothetical protein
VAARFRIVPSISVYPYRWVSSQLEVRCPDVGHPVRVGCEVGDGAADITWGLGVGEVWVGGDGITPGIGGNAEMVEHGLRSQEAGGGSSPDQLGQRNTM